MAQLYARVPVTVTRPTWRLALARAVARALSWRLAPQRVRVWIFCRMAEWVLNGFRVSIAGRRSRARVTVRAEAE